MVQFWWQVLQQTDKWFTIRLSNDKYGGGCWIGTCWELSDSHFKTYNVTIKKDLKQSWLPAFWTQSKNTQKGRKNALFFPQASNWQNISELFVFVLYVAWKKRISSKIRALCLVMSKWKAFFLTICVFSYNVTVLHHLKHGTPLKRRRRRGWGKGAGGGLVGGGGLEWERNVSVKEITTNQKVTVKALWNKIKLHLLNKPVNHNLYAYLHPLPPCSFVSVYFTRKRNLKCLTKYILRLINWDTPFVAFKCFEILFPVFPRARRSLFSPPNFARIFFYSSVLYCIFAVCNHPDQTTLFV